MVAKGGDNRRVNPLTIFEELLTRKGVPLMVLTEQAFVVWIVAVWIASINPFVW